MSKIIPKVTVPFKGLIDLQFKTLVHQIEQGDQVAPHSLPEHGVCTPRSHVSWQCSSIAKNLLKMFLKKGF